MRQNLKLPSVPSCTVRPDGAGKGLMFALVTAACWGTLPFMLQGLLGQVSIYTVAWVQFAGSFVLLGASEAVRGHLPSWNLIQRLNWIQWLLASALLGIYYLLYLMGLERTSPAVAQVLMQISPVWVTLGAALIYRESFSSTQRVYLVWLMIGVALFSEQAIEDIIFSNGRYFSGMLLLLLSGLAYAAQVLMQQQLLKQTSASHLLLLFYGATALMLFPFARVDELSTLKGESIVLLGLCCLSTLLAFGCFSRSLQHWSAVQTSTIITLSPFITLFSELALSHFFSSIKLTTLNFAEIVGMGFIVFSAIGITAGRFNK